MKSVEEIQNMLVHELWDKLNRIRSIKRSLNYYNEMLGNTSYLLAGLLESLLRNQFDDWNSKKWIDDSLLTKIKLNKDKLAIWGVMIWGIQNKTEQWTEPFYFEIKLNKNILDFTNYTFLFSDLDNPKLSYEDFKQRRDYWDKQYYINKNWGPSERNWKYIITSKMG